MSFPRYPKYKNSGVEWLGEVPEHWIIKPIRLAAKLESGHTPSRSHPEYWENCTVPWITLADVWQIRDCKAKYILETKEQVSELGLANSSARLLPKNTVILSRTASVGYSAIMSADMATTQDFANWICGPTLLPEFLLNVFRGMRGEFDRLMMGSTHNTIYMPDIQSFRFAEPSVAEQNVIIAFLDRETAKIDALVGEQRRLIELLKEKRQALISHAVTKGLNPHAAMKSSGVEWLGDVPDHWGIVALKKIAILKSGDSITAESIEETGNYPVLGGNGLRRYTSGFTHDGNFVVIGRQGALCGNINYATGKFWASEHAVVASPLKPVETKWLGEMLRAMNLNQHSVSAAQPGLSMEFVGNLQTILPPLTEQTAIAVFLDRETVKIDALTAEAERAIDLLQERRTALISAAVTGKIDVRELA